MQCLGHTYTEKLEVACQGLPWWVSGKEPTCQLSRHGFHPWSEKIPHVGAAKPMHHNYWACALEPWSHNCWSLPACSPCSATRVSLVAQSWPHGLQHTRLPCPSPTPRVCSNSCPSSRWCHPASSSSVVPFSSHLQSFPASGSFQMSQFFTSGGQSIGVSASASVLPMKETATHSSTLAWKIPWTEEPGRLQSMGSQRVRHSWAASLSFFLSLYVL